MTVQAEEVRRKKCAIKRQSEKRKEERKKERQKGKQVEV